MPIRANVVVAGLFVIASRAALAQNATSRLEFEAASVKSSSPPQSGGVFIGRRGGPGTNDPGRAAFSYLTLKALLTVAYGIKVYQISGPGWLDTEPYDIVATVPEGATKEQFNEMLQNLLLDRFALKLHHETKDLPLYELSVAKNGTTMKASNIDPNAPVGMPPGPPALKDGFPGIPPGRKAMVTAMSNGNAWTSAAGQSISALVDLLGNQLGAPVVDKTGLAGLYDFTLNFALEPGRSLGPLAPPLPPSAAPSPALPGAANDPNEPPAIAAAIQEQLGLRLERKKGPVDVLVIDHAGKLPRRTETIIGTKCSLSRKNNIGGPERGRRENGRLCSKPHTSSHECLHDSNACNV